MYNSAGTPADARNYLTDAVDTISRCFTSRRSGLTAAMLGLLSQPGRTCCVSHLSLECPHYTHDGLLSAVNHGSINTGRLTGVLHRGASRLPGFDGVYTVDETSWLRVTAATTGGRMMVRDAASASRGLAADAGWSYSVVGAQTGVGTVPVAAVRIGTGDDVHEVTISQVKQVVQARAAQGLTGRPLFVLDAGYSYAAMVLLATRENLDVDFLVRLSSSRVFYGGVPDGAPRKRGLPQKHTTRLDLADPQQPADHTAVHTTDGGVTVTARVWEGYHQWLRAANRMGRYTDLHNPVLPVTIINYHKDGHTGPGLWVAYTGEAGTRDVHDLYTAYVGRFGTEHTFRFMKQTLGMTRFHTVSAAAADVWVWLVVCATAVTAGAVRVVKRVFLPWERHRPVTWGQVRRGLSEHARALLERVGVRVNTNCGYGWPKGAPRKPRDRAPTLVKGSPGSRSARRFS